VSVIHAVVVNLVLYTLSNLCQSVRDIFSLANFGGLLWGSTVSVSRYPAEVIPRSNHPCLYTETVVPRLFNQTQTRWATALYLLKYKCLKIIQIRELVENKVAPFHGK